MLEFILGTEGIPGVGIHLPGTGIIFQVYMTETGGAGIHLSSTYIHLPRGSIHLPGDYIHLPGVDIHLPGFGIHLPGDGIHS